MSLVYEPPSPGPDREPGQERGVLGPGLPKGMTDDGVTLTLRERPTFLWLIGGVFVGVGLVFGATGSTAAPVILTLIGAPVLVLVGPLVVTADRRSRVLTIERRSLLRPSRVEVPFSDVRSIEMRTSRSTDSDGDSTPTYRTVVVRYETDPVPFRSYWESGGSATRRQKAQLLDAAVTATVNGQDVPRAE